ncbi:MAG: GNAT family N-acetyltransferase [Bacillota bacterium]|nr:GNAT family N-acetyltransferase [Bacillota bacterium]
MEIRLEKAIISDAQAIFDIQVKAFMPLLEKYKDYDTSPANETVERAIERIETPNGGFYKIISDDILVGAVRVVLKEGNSHFRLSILFILPEYQGKGVAQKAISIMEEMYSHATSWELDTILEEEGNCYLYEKLGYSKTGTIRKLNERTTLVSYLRVL